MTKTATIAMAATHCGATEPIYRIAGIASASATISTKPMASWIAVSMVIARNLLPIPASGNSSAVCSGVSMVSLSRGSTRDLHSLAGKAAPALESARATGDHERTQECNRVRAGGGAGVGTIVSAIRVGLVDGARRSNEHATGDLPESVAGARAQSDLHGPARESRGHLDVLQRHIPRNFSRNISRHVDGVCAVPGGCARRGVAGSGRSVVLAIFSGPGDDAVDRAAQNVDGLDCDGEAAGFDRDHDQ